MSGFQANAETFIENKMFVFKAGHIYPLTTLYYNDFISVTAED